MVLIFPLIGIFLSVIDVFINKPFSAKVFPAVILYAVGYTLLAAFCFIAFLVVLSLFVDLKKPNKKFNKPLDKPHRVWYNKDTKRAGREERNCREVGSRTG